MTYRTPYHPRLSMLALAVGLACSQHALAETYNWTGAVSSDWTNAGNWQWGSGSQPGPADKASIDSITPHATELGSSVTTSINELVVGGGNTGTLDIFGTLTTNYALIGNSAGAVGTVTVSGSGLLNIGASGLVLGNEGVGTLTVESGAFASSTGTVYLGAASGGSGTLNIDTGGGFDAGTSMMLIGYGGSGAVSITEGTLESNGALLGAASGSDGTVTVDGANSSWTNDGSLIVGSSGAGQLDVLNGASVTTQEAVLAAAAASGVTVSGAGSELDIDGAFYVGIGGNATLHIADGGTVWSDATVVARHASSVSEVTVTGTGSSWNTGDLLLGGDPGDPSSFGGTATLEVLDGASVSTAGARLGGVANGSGTVTIDDATWTSSGLLSIGYAGSGSFTVQNGALANTNGGLIVGHLAGSVGIGSVTGVGSSLNNTGNLYIGNEGDGTLTIADGASASSTGTVYLGAASGGSGTLNIDTGGSFDAGTSTMLIGYGGSGAVNITEGTLESDGAVLGAGSGSDGTVTVDGANSSWTNNGSLTVGSSGTGQLDVLNGASVTTQQTVLAAAAASSLTVSGAGSELDIDGAFYVGIGGNATLNIADGGSVSSGATVVARHASSVSEVTVTGTGSSWTTAGLLLGGDPGDPSSLGGTATLEVLDGASISTGQALLGGVADGSGSVTVDDASWTASDRISVGYGGEGSLTVQNGATVSSTGGLIGHLAGSSGTVSVSGAGSSWDNSGVLYVGNEGDGSLSITQGGSVTSTDGYVGVATGASGSLTIAGSGSEWINSGDLLVGQQGGATGTVNISGGGRLESLQGILGDLVGASGSLIVTGSGSTWTTSSDLNVGRFGSGSLVVTDGAQAQGGRVYVANESGSAGTVLISGAGSSLGSDAALHVGTAGNGTLTVTDGGTVSAVTRLNIATQSGSVGVLNFGAAAGASAGVAGEIDSPMIVFGAGTGTLNLNYLGDYALAADISGVGSIRQWAGNTTLSGNSSAFAGTTEVSGGTLTVNGSLGGSLLIDSGATLSGSGSVGTTTVSAGGVIAPNAPGSTLTVNGNFTLESGALYVVQASNTAADRITVNGNAALAGDLSIQAASSEYNARVRYTILSATGLVSGNFDSIASDFAFVTPVVSYTSDEVYLTLNPNGVGYADVSRTSNQASVANVLNAAALNSATSEAFNQVLLRIDTLSAGQAQTAFESMSGRAHLGLSSLGLLSSTLQNVGRFSFASGGVSGGSGFSGLSDGALMVAANEARDTMTDVSGGLGLSLRPVRQRLLWAQAVGGHGNARSDGNAPGYKSNSGGVLMGADMEVSQHLALGVAYQFSDTRLKYDSLGDTAAAQGHQLSVYGRYAMDDWRIKAIAGYGWNNYDTHRDIIIGNDVTRARAKYDGRELGVFLEAAYRIEQGTYAIEPVLSVQNVVLHQDGFQEKGAGVLGLSAGSRTSRSLVSMLGGRLQRALGDAGLTGEVRAFWSRQWADRGSDVDLAFQGVPGATYRVSGLKQERDSAVIGFGVAGNPTAPLTLQLDYNLGVDKRETQHTLIAGLKYRW
ncbi:autotransporter domain-containing protein [Parazoarcus communis]|uniref:autotransporter domain-containing protein n=1 Tax=Parazoarcus communis TaxID=41977 RepID=UPI0014592941|nr:autotransporter domain-containing protein [Parazoarcus communis]